MVTIWMYYTRENVIDIRSIIYLSRLYLYFLSILVDNNVKIHPRLADYWAYSNLIATMFLRTVTLTEGWLQN